jgi:hypothetical protein
MRIAPERPARIDMSQCNARNASRAGAVQNTGGVARANVPLKSGGCGCGWWGRRVVIGEHLLGRYGA